MGVSCFLVNVRYWVGWNEVGWATVRSLIAVGRRGFQSNSQESSLIRKTSSHLFIHRLLRTCWFSRFVVGSYYEWPLDKGQPWSWAQNFFQYWTPKVRTMYKQNLTANTENETLIVIIRYVWLHANCSWNAIYYYPVRFIRWTMPFDIIYTICFNPTLSPISYLWAF